MNWLALFVCFSKICRGGKWWLHKGNKIVLIGHSFGGIIIKSLTVEASKHASSCEKCKTFLECTKGMIFYAVPHSGRLIAQYVENYNKAFPHRLDGVLKKLKEFETEMETLSKEFEDSLQIPSKYKDHRHVIEIYSFAEQLPYNKVSSLSPLLISLVKIIFTNFSSAVWKWQFLGGICNWRSWWCHGLQFPNWEAPLWLLRPIICTSASHPWKGIGVTKSSWRSWNCARPKKVCKKTSETNSLGLQCSSEKNLKWILLLVITTIILHQWLWQNRRRDWTHNLPAFPAEIAVLITGIPSGTEGRGII